MNEQLRQLADALRSGALVAFIGAGASATFQDSGSGREWIGLPTAGQIVDEMSRDRGYVGKHHSFPQACFLWKMREGRGSLEKYLLARLDKPNIKPLPSHCRRRLNTGPPAPV